eukprot:1131777-Rhodomonas_salina.2
MPGPMWIAADKPGCLYYTRRAPTEARLSTSDRLNNVRTPLPHRRIRWSGRRIRWSGHKLLCEAVVVTELQVRLAGRLHAPYAISVPDLHAPYAISVAGTAVPGWLHSLSQSRTSRSVRVQCEITSKKPHSWYKLY